MTTQLLVADAIRKVTAAVQAELEAGRRSTHPDANDLLKVLLAVADELDLPSSNDKRDGYERESEAIHCEANKVEKAQADLNNRREQIEQRMRQA